MRDGFVASVLQVCCKRVALQQKPNVEKEIEIEIELYSPQTPQGGKRMKERIETMKTPTTDRWKYRKNQRTQTYHQEDEVGYPALAAAIVRQAV